MLLCLAREDLLERRPEWRTRDAGVEHARARAAVGGRHPRAGALPAPCRRGRGSRLDERLAERAEGNPLFAEQLVALLREGGDVSLPPTIQALLAARLDRLAPAERAAVGAASVVGREFWGDAVATLLPDQDAAGGAGAARGAGRASGW